MVASNVGSWETPCPGNVHAGMEAPLHHDVVDLVVVLSTWAVPCPPSRCLVWAKRVRQHQVVVAGEFQEPQASLVCLCITVSPTCAFPVLASILSYFGVPIALHNQNVSLGSDLGLLAAGRRSLLQHRCHSRMLGRMPV